MSNSSIRKQPLGRGLSALLGPEINTIDEDTTQKLKPIKTSLIEPNRYQPRKNFNEEEIDFLAASIKEVGILQPILVREGKEGHYELIAGERRWRAAVKLGLEHIPAIIREFSDVDSFESALIENMQRQNLNPLEEAEGIKRLMEYANYSQEEVSKKLGKSRSYTANVLRLLTLPDKVKEYLKEGKISAGHARALINAKNPEVLVESVVQNGLNVRQTELLARDGKMLNSFGINPNRDSSYFTNNNIEKPNDIKVLEAELSNLLKTFVRVNLRGSSGEIIVSFRDLEKFDELIAKFALLET